MCTTKGVYLVRVVNNSSQNLLLLRLFHKNASLPGFVVVGFLVAVNVSFGWIDGVGKTWEIFVVPYKIKDHP